MLGLTRSILFVFGGLLFATPGHTQTFDAAADFSLAGNPNGAWSYGYSTSLTSALIPHMQSGGNGGIEFWRTVISLGVPGAFYNSTANVVLTGTQQFQPHQFALHPGPANQYEKARLIIPTSDTYAITGAFAGADVVGTTTDVHILLNGVSLFNGNVSGFGANTGPSFALTQTLSANDVIDFAVGFGSNGNFLFDTTALSAHIARVVPSGVPEPGGMALLVSASIAGAGVVLRRRRKS